MDGFQEDAFQQDSFDSFIQIIEPAPENIIKKSAQSFAQVKAQQNLVVAKKQDIKVHKINNTIIVPKNGDIHGN
ncbi:MAG TPA: hypothetical protein DIV86_01585 [Alphaproteobacteria bacterium]|nr:hypothetical protein [Alphaproteobacteria bacterium]